MASRAAAGGCHERVVFIRRRYRVSGYRPRVSVADVPHAPRSWRPAQAPAGTAYTAFTPDTACTAGAASGGTEAGAAGLTFNA
jgi:hypothetical protein